MPIKLLLLSAHVLWAQAYGRVLGALPRPAHVVAVGTGDALRRELQMALAQTPDVVLLFLDQPPLDLPVLTSLRALGCRAPAAVVCAAVILPSLSDLEQHNVQGLVSSRAGLDDLVGVLYALADGHPAPLAEQYAQAAQNSSGRERATLLNAREQEILTLVATGLTDRAIAARLQLSTRTVNNYLGAIYAKLGVSGRTDAVAQALRAGLLSSAALWRTPNHPAAS